eukprot:Amastigsp_a676911_43.p2 type:complete len:167 gc:universal Amastigsp_a676911_43:655-155(-)
MLTPRSALNELVALDEALSTLLANRAIDQENTHAEDPRARHCNCKPDSKAPHDAAKKEQKRVQRQRANNSQSEESTHNHILPALELLHIPEEPREGAGNILPGNKVKDQDNQSAHKQASDLLRRADQPPPPLRRLGFFGERLTDCAACCSCSRRALRLRRYRRHLV